MGFNETELNKPPDPAILPELSDRLSFPGTPSQMWKLSTVMLDTGAHRRGWRTGVGGWDGARWAPGSGCSFPAAQLHLGAAACSGAAGAQHLQGTIWGIGCS